MFFSNAFPPSDAQSPLCSCHSKRFFLMSGFRIFNRTLLSVVPFFLKLHLSARLKIVACPELAVLTSIEVD
jgi:hypothetical protein